MRRRPLIDKILLGFAAAFLIAIGVTSYLGSVPRWVGVGYGVASILALSVYGLDKYRAQRERWRISEAALHSFELIGGWPGALIAQRLFRHKNRKVSFQIVFWLIVITHLALWGWVVSRHFPGKT